MINVTGTIAKSANIVKDSVVIGDVTIGEDSTVLFYAVLRGNDNKIVIGNGTNIRTTAPSTLLPWTRRLSGTTSRWGTMPLFTAVK